METENSEPQEPQLDSNVVYLLARLFSGLPVELAATEVSEQWAVVIERLRVLPLTDRPGALEAELVALPDVDGLALCDAIIACDPRGPLPSPQPVPPSTPFPVSPIYRETTETDSSEPRLVSLAELLDRRDLEIRWTVDRLIPVGGVAIIGGPPGYGKSWALLDLAIECARGGLWLGRFPTMQSPVLYFDEESALVLLHSRLRRLINAKRAVARDLNVHFGAPYGVCLSDPKSVATLDRVINQYKPGLVIFDSLIRVHRAEENSASDMSKVFAEVKTLVRKHGCTMVFADHQRKPGHLAGSQDLLLRGSTDKLAFIDTLLSLYKRDGKLVIEHSKPRYGIAVPDFVIEIVDSGPMATTINCIGDADSLRQEERASEARAFILKALQGGGWISRQDLVAQGKDVRVGSKAIDASLKSMTGDDLEHEKRKPEGKRGGKSDHYRLRSYRRTEDGPAPSDELSAESDMSNPRGDRPD